jgi:hydrogenase 3 maturation protease
MELDRLSDHLTGRVVIVGVGNRMKGDDGFGPIMIDGLRGRVKVPLFDCGTVPENFLQPIRKERPQTVLVLDAADLSDRPGTLSVIEPMRWRGGGFSSHSISLKLFADLISQDTGAGVFLVAVQPKRLGLGEQMSPEVREGCRRLQRWLEDALSAHS